jgi:two-component system, OmpR family, response regulator
MRILLLEDDAELTAAVTRRLRKAGLAVDEAASLFEATQLVAESAYDCLVLDRTVPGGDSLSLVGAVRSREQYVPVMLVSAHIDVGDRVAAFEAGVDDYLPKPFSLDELTCRVLALGRRAGQVLAPVLRAGDLVVDSSRCQVHRGGVRVDLTAKELAVLEMLMRKSGEVVTRSDLVEHCWGERESPFSNVVEVHMASLRRKIAAPGLIRTVRGVGYSLDPP